MVGVVAYEWISVGPAPWQDARRFLQAILQDNNFQTLWQVERSLALSIRETREEIFWKIKWPLKIEELSCEWTKF